MMRLSDATIVAITKLRTRRLRTLVTVFVASILFGAMFTAVFMTQGIIDSTLKFSKGTLADRYFATATYQNQINMTDESLPISVIDRAKALFKKDITDKQAAAKRLGVDYDSSIETEPTVKLFDSEILNGSSPYAAQAFKEYLADLPTPQQELDKIVGKYVSKNIYEVGTTESIMGRMKMIGSVGENFTEAANYPSNGTVDVNFGWSYMDEGVVSSFMLPESQLSRQKNTEAIPIIAPISKVEAALGLKKLSNNTSANDKLERLKYIRDNADKATFSVCYRNSVSSSQIQSAIDNAKALKNNKNYIEPALTYALPIDANACAPATVKRDIRTADEKKQDAKQIEFNQMFGQETEPFQKKLIFRVVGLSPEGFNAGNMSNIGGLILNITSTNLMSSWIVPQKLFDAMPNNADLNFIKPGYNSDKLDYFDYSQMYKSEIVEFGGIDELKNFVVKEGCDNFYCDGGKTIYYFGNNSVLIGEIKDQAAKYLGYAALVITVIAVIILMSMIGRVISDSRRETAVFRAIGARRSDIRLIYFSYTLMLSIIVAIVSLGIGYAAIQWIDSIISPDATVQSHLINIFADDNLKFSFVGFWWQALASIAVLVIVGGFVGMILPLSRNSVRNPIRDMRDDT
ncbi:ABC transporter permease [Candidatus Saccharibacteria bacterium]|nr:ABC transporter permease [Candidatus Saccharibacteria bacterium]